MILRSALAAFVTALLTLLAGASACQPAPVQPNGDGTSGTETAAAEAPMGTTFAGPGACQSSEECETDAQCVAPYDPGSDPPMGQGGCIEACIEIDDLTRWCFDDESCCGDARCHVVDGLCEPGPGSSATGTSTGTGTGDTGTSSDMGTSSGTGTSSTSTSTSSTGTSTSSTG